MKRYPWLALAGMLLAILGTKFFLISTYGRAVPRWDQWRAEGLYMLVPFFAGKLTLPKLLLTSHGAHRLLWTRLVALALVLLTGEWNQIPQMVINALLLCCFIVAITITLWNALPDRTKWVAVAAPLLIYASPFPYEATVFGFNTQYSFNLLFNFAAFTLLMREDFDLRSALLCATAVVASSFNMSGSMIVPACTVPLLWLWWKAGGITTPALKRRVWFCGLLLLICLALYKPTNLDETAARSPAEFFRALQIFLSWPAPSLPIFAIANVMAVLVGARMVAKGAFATHSQRLIVLLGMYAVVQAFALAYMRGRPPYIDSTKYAEVSNLYIFCTFFIASWLFACRRKGAMLALPAYAILVAGSLAVGWIYLGWDPRALNAVHTRQVREFMLTQNPSAFSTKRPIDRDLNAVRTVLTSPGIAAVLPASMYGRPSPPGVALFEWLISRYAFLWTLGTILLLFDLARRSRRRSALGSSQADQLRVSG